jgi:hypothetical protein
VIGRPLLDPSYDAEVALDTSPDAQRRQDDVFRAMSPDQRAAMAAEMSEAAFEIAETGIRLRHPGYTDEEVRLTGIRLRIGDDLFVAAFPSAPLLAP